MSFFQGQAQTTNKRLMGKKKKASLTLLRTIVNGRVMETCSTANKKILFEFAQIVKAKTKATSLVNLYHLEENKRVFDKIENEYRKVWYLSLGSSISGNMILPSGHTITNRFEKAQIEINKYHKELSDSHTDILKNSHYGHAQVKALRKKCLRQIDEFSRHVPQLVDKLAGMDIRLLNESFVQCIKGEVGLAKFYFRIGTSTRALVVLYCKLINLLNATGIIQGRLDPHDPDFIEDAVDGRSYPDYAKMIKKVKKRLKRIEEWKEVNVQESCFSTLAANMIDKSVASCIVPADWISLSSSSLSRFSRFGSLDFRNRRGKDNILAIKSYEYSDSILYSNGPDIVVFDMDYFRTGDHFHWEEGEDKEIRPRHCDKEGCDKLSENHWKLEMKVCSSTSMEEHKNYVSLYNTKFRKYLSVDDKSPVLKSPRSLDASFFWTTSDSIKDKW